MHYLCRDSVLKNEDEAHRFPELVCHKGWRVIAREFFHIP